MKIRTDHDIKVPSHLMHHAIKEFDPEGLDQKYCQSKNVKKNERKKQSLVSEELFWVVSLDRHDTLCGYQN